MEKWVYLDRSPSGEYHVYLKECDASGYVNWKFLMSVKTYEEFSAIHDFWNTVKDHLT